MAINMESQYALRKAALARMAQPSSVAAVPDLGEIAGEYAAARGRVSAEAAKHTRDISFAEKSLAEKNRQFYAGLDLDREQLETWAEQNKWATAIAVANLGIQALQVPAQLRQEEKQGKFVESILGERKRQVDATIAGNKENAAAQTKALSEIRAIIDYNARLQEARNLVGDPETMAEIAANKEKTDEGTTAIRKADQEFFPQQNTPDLFTVARRKAGGGGMPVWYQH